ncbi:MAG: Cro/Cl family transcriptional regulator [Flavobacteriaceae bacterium]|nr:Cro/Cl family transcriptional regulator [Flavobacteriaceae bacterium]|tara:strand:- start:121 stop:318 length:198 start_codon:yes stop_codon:yes gene_type:complete
MKKSQAVAHFGSQEALAEFCDVSPQAVSQWPGEHIPLGHQYRIQLETGGKLIADKATRRRGKKAS